KTTYPTNRKKHFILKIIITFQFEFFYSRIKDFRVLAFDDTSRKFFNQPVTVGSKAGARVVGWV
ncbi:MAG: hypothetical protein K8H85_13880, partial [Cyclobacteriaceae bacterium]|nr:hypothetical protein [Cyclobacteriaceae bacterium]